MHKCSEIMTTNPVCCLPRDTVQRAAQIMKTEDVGPVPVVESQASKKLVGIITDRDLVLNVLAEGRTAQHTRVEEVMTRDMITCREQDNVDKAIQAMAQYQIRRIPIVNANREIVGIIAQADVATRVEEPDKTAKVVEEISKPETAIAGG